ncbi:MAG: hypothetical protein Q4G03_07785 [Planctomycetia bacterium]|nr:hypothetical protein [Planctomycetia bacterium]
MASRQKDIKTFLKKLTKRYPTTLLTRPADGSVLSQLVFAIFLENSSFEKARVAYEAMEQYFIDWNEIRVSRANEIAEVVQPLYDVLKVGERLRRILQWIFDRDYKFDIEQVRAFTPQERLDYLEAIPYTTRFMNDFVRLTTFNEPCLPLDEGALRVLRLWGLVEVDSERQIEVVTGLKKAALSLEDLRALCFSLHCLGAELLDDELSADAMKFIVSCDSAAAKRSINPLVVPKRLSDPVEIARFLEKQSRMVASERKEEEFALDDEADDPDQFQEDGEYEDDSDQPGYDDVDVEETSLSRDDASYGVASVSVKPERKSKRSAKAPAEDNLLAVLTPAEEKVEVSDSPVVKPESAKAKVKPAKKAPVKRAKAAEIVANQENTDAKPVASEASATAVKSKAAKTKKSVSRAVKEEVILFNDPALAQEKAMAPTDSGAVKAIEKQAPKTHATGKKSASKSRKSASVDIQPDTVVLNATASPVTESVDEKPDVPADAKSASKKSTKSAKSAKAAKSVKEVKAVKTTEESTKKRPVARKKNAPESVVEDAPVESATTKKASAKKESVTRKSTRRVSAEPDKTNAMEPPDASADQVADSKAKKKVSIQKEPKKATAKRASTSRKTKGEITPTKVEKNQQKKPR